VPIGKTTITVDGTGYKMWIFKENDQASYYVLKCEDKLFTIPKTIELAEKVSDAENKKMRMLTWYEAYKIKSGYESNLASAFSRILEPEERGYIYDPESLWESNLTAVLYREKDTGSVSIRYCNKRNSFASVVILKCAAPEKTAPKVDSESLLRQN
jgi:hypothetical protein